MALNKIEHIVTVGTSFTHGGGYAEVGDTIQILKKYESNIPHPQEECAWPAFLQKQISPDIKIHNLALSGSGVEYLMRTVDEWIEKNPSKVETTLFLLEVSGYGRMEFWDNQVNRYVVCNWDYGVRRDKFFVSLHTGLYWRDSRDLTDKITSGEIQVRDFLNRYCDPMKSVEYLQSHFFNFLCKLKYKDIEFKVFGEHFYNEAFNNDPVVKDNRLYLTDRFGGVHHGIHQFIEANQVQIKHITRGESDDFHACLEGNRQIAEQYYNQLRQVYNL